MKLGLSERLCVLRFAASFLWADLSLDLAEHVWFVALATELGFDRHQLPEVAALLDGPPPPDEVDPTRVPLRLVPAVRDVALRAIASDGRVAPREMELFDLLDELLPAGAPAPPSFSPRTA
ncbi:MAG: hypothetical protein JWP97_943 [Labilithrix sp.]|nr:hypothetical protein [Labilithrix sp.]